MTVTPCWWGALMRRVGLRKTESSARETRPVARPLERRKRRRSEDGAWKGLGVNARSAAAFDAAPVGSRGLAINPDKAVL